MPNPRSGVDFKRSQPNFVSSFLEDRSQSRIGQILQTEFQRVKVRRVSHRVHVRLSREVIGG